MDLGVRTWGNDPDGRDVRLVGCFQMRGEVSQRLLDALPAVLVLTPRRLGLTADPRCSPNEIARDEPGQQAVLDRLFDLLLIAAIRAPGSPGRRRRPGLVPRAPRPGRRPRRAVAARGPGAAVDRRRARGRAAGISRARFARRFTELVGEPPMTYLTRWRLALAADLLREPQPPSRRSPPASATATASRSAPRSSAFAASARPRIGTTSRASSVETGRQVAGGGDQLRRCPAPRRARPRRRRAARRPPRPTPCPAREAHSRTEWYSWPPVKMFGVGSPRALRIEPSVPPRIGTRRGSKPSRRSASSRGRGRPPGGGRGSVRMFGYCGSDVELEPRARLGRDDLLGGPAQQRDVLGEPVVVEVAHDRADRRRAAPSPRPRRRG